MVFWLRCLYYRRNPLRRGEFWIKTNTFYNTEILYLAVQAPLEEKVTARKWLLDGVKMTEPNRKSVTHLAENLKNVKFEFRDVKKGETIVVEWHR
ncbi:MAG: hypothetical protein ACP5UO_03425 [Thermoplasmata archaeon]